MNVTDLSSRGFYWWYRAPQRTLIFAVAFGLGPRVAAENLLLDLGLCAEDDIRWRCTDESPVPCISDIDLFINFGVLEEVTGLRPEYRVWVDCVDWLRTSLPGHIKDYDMLLRDAFFPSELTTEKGNPQKWREVQPLIRPRTRDASPDQDLVVLSFGGVSTPYSSDVHSVAMPLAFMRGVARAAKSAKHKRVLAFLPDKLRSFADLEANVCGSMDLLPLGRASFQDAMCRCGLLVCQPGLYTPFEAMRVGLPFALAFPMSFTQAMQAERLAALGARTHPAVFDQDKSDAGILPSIESAEAEWFANSSAQWTIQRLASVEGQVELFIQQILDSSPSDLIVTPPSGPTTTAASAIRHERPTWQSAKH